MHLAAQTEAQILLEQQERQKSDADMAATQLLLHSHSFAAQQVATHLLLCSQLVAAQQAATSCSCIACCLQLSS
jgi:hypothetical protein